MRIALIVRHAGSPPWRNAAVIFLALFLVTAAPAQTFNLREYFPLHANDTWHYTGIVAEGGTPNDNFRWRVESDTFAVNGVQASQIRTITDDINDARNNDRDLWHVVPGSGSGIPNQNTAGSLNFYGVRFAKPVQLGFATLNEVIFTDPVFVGGDGSLIGGTNGSDQGTAIINPGTGPIPITINSLVQYVGFETITTPLGIFNNALHLKISISAVIPPPINITYPLKSGEFWLGRNLGLLKYDEDASANARVSAIDEGFVNGSPFSGACAYFLDPLSADFDERGGNGTVKVTTSNASCAWTANSNAAWLTVTSGTAGLGTHVVGYSVQRNDGTATRVGALQIAGTTHTVTQTAPCDVDLGTTFTIFSRFSGTGFIQVTGAIPGCGYLAVSNDPWIIIDGGESGNGSGTVAFHVTQNTGPLRQGTITINRRVHTVIQGTACFYNLEPPATSVSPLGGNGSFMIVATVSDCGWSAASNNSWITLLSPASGFGTTQLNYRVNENLGPPRTGSIAVNGLVYTISQGINADYNKIENYILGRGTLTPAELNFADANFDDKVDVADLVTMINQQPAPITAIHWIKPGDGDWNVAGNWSLNRVPNSTDVVVIDSTGTLPVTVTIPANVTVRDLRMPGRTRLRAADNLRIAGATLTANGPIQMNGGSFTLDTGALFVNAAATAWIPGPATMNNSRLQVRNGGRILLPALNAITYAVPNSNVTLLDAQGTNCLIDLPAVTALTYSTGATSQRTARIIAGATGQPAGGTVNLPQLATFTRGNFDYIGFESGNGGALNAPLAALTERLNFVAGPNGTLALPGIIGELRNAAINIGSTSTLSLPAVTGFEAVPATINGTLAAPQLASIINSSLTMASNAMNNWPLLTQMRRGAGAANPTLSIQGTAVTTLPALRTLENINLTLNNSGRLTAAVLENYLSTNSTTLLQVLSSGATCVANGLSNLTNVRITLRAGGRLSLPAMGIYNWNLASNAPLFDVAGTGSQLDFPALATLVYPGGTTARTFRILAGATGAATANGTINAPQLENALNSNLHITSLEATNGGTLNLPKFKNAAQLTLIANTLGSLSLPGITGGLSDTTINVGTTGSLTLGNVTAFDDVTVTANGSLALPVLGTISNSPITIGSTAVINWPQLTGISRGASATNRTLTVQNNARLTLPALTTITDTNLTFSNNANVSLPALTGYTSTNSSTLWSLNGGTVATAANLLSSLTNVRIQLRSGATLALPTLTTYLWNIAASPTLFDVNGAGSQLNLPNLGLITFNTGTTTNRTATILAGAGTGTPTGNINLSGWNSVAVGTNHRFTITANGASTQINISGLTPLPAAVTLNPLNGGTILN